MLIYTNTKKYNDKSIFEEIWIRFVKKCNRLESTFCYLATIESSLDFLMFLCL